LCEHKDVDSLGSLLHLEWSLSSLSKVHFAEKAEEEREKADPAGIDPCGSRRFMAKAEYRFKVGSNGEYP
jgi:hypothetical protein